MPRRWPAPWSQIVGPTFSPGQRIGTKDELRRCVGVAVATMNEAWCADGDARPGGGASGVGWRHQPVAMICAYPPLQSIHRILSDSVESGLGDLDFEFIAALSPLTSDTPP